MRNALVSVIPDQRNKKGWGKREPGNRRGKKQQEEGKKKKIWSSPLNVENRKDAPHLGRGGELTTKKVEGIRKQNRRVIIRIHE